MHDNSPFLAAATPAHRYQRNCGLPRGDISRQRGNLLRNDNPWTKNERIDPVY